jgi:DNA-binding NarL/FixJ family response regulator
MVTQTVNSDMLDVLIVDDSEKIRESLTRLLSIMDNVNVIGFSEMAHDAIEKIKSSMPDVVLLDLKLKEGTGFDVLEKLRHHKKKPLMLVISNYTSGEVKKKCIELGADHFFDKSEEFENALNLVKELGFAKA